MWKKVLFAGIGFIAVIAAIVIFVFTKTSGLTDEADRFFDLLKKGDYAGARNMTSAAFQRATTEEQLAAFSKLFTFDKLASTSFPTRGLNDEKGYLEGDVTYSDGTKQPVRIDFVEENGKWRVQQVTPRSGIESASTEASNLPAPTVRQIAPKEEEAKLLVNRSIQMLADAIVRRNFDDFYQYISKMWQTQTTSKDLLVAFKEFIDQDIDLIQTQNTTITIQPPQIDLQNALNIDAEWSTKPVRTTGNFRYINEQGEWRLIGVAVKLKE